MTKLHKSVDIQAQHHPWLNPNSHKGDLELSKEALSNLVSFRDTNFLKKVSLELVARTLDNEQIRDLEKEFEKVMLVSMKLVCHYELV